MDRSINFIKARNSSQPSKMNNKALLKAAPQAIMHKFGFSTKVKKNKSSSTRITSKLLKHKLEERFPEIINISFSTIQRVLKSKFNMSYKKLSKRNLRTEKPENNRKLLLMTAIIQKLIDDGWELIYFDGFGWDSRKQIFYGWSKKE